MAVAMRNRTKRELFWFFGLTMVVMYTFCFLFIGYEKEVAAFMGRYFSHPSAEFLLYIAAYSPTGVALLLTGVFGRVAGYRRIVASALRWRIGWWGLICVLIVPVIWLAVAVFQALALGRGIDLSAWYRVLPVVFVSQYILFDTGGLGEELGWRGFAQSRLLEGFTPLTAAIFIGIAFGLWHLPAWLLSNDDFWKLNFFTFLGGTIAISVLFSFLFVKARGNFVAAGVIPHMVMNACGDGGANLYKIDISYFAPFTVIVVLIVWIGRRQMLQAPPFDPALSLQYYSKEEEQEAIRLRSRPTQTET